MKLSVTAFAFACAVLWGGCLLLVGMANVMLPAYGNGFLHAMSSVYPGFHASGKVTDLLVGAGEGLLDGVIGGALLAMLYNVIAGRLVLRHHPQGRVSA